MKPGTHFRRFNQEWMWVQPADKLHHSGLIKSVSNDEKRGFAVNMQTGELTVLPYEEKRIKATLTFHQHEPHRYMRAFFCLEELPTWLTGCFERHSGVATLQVEEAGAAMPVIRWEDCEYSQLVEAIRREGKRRAAVRVSEQAPESFSPVLAEVFDDNDNHLRTVEFKDRKRFLNYFRAVFINLHTSRKIVIKIGDLSLCANFTADTSWQINLKKLEKELDLLFSTYRETLKSIYWRIR